MSRPHHSALLHNVLLFGRLLRRLGLDVHTCRLLDVVEALPLVDLGRREDVYHTCRALLVHRHEELAAFDRTFAVYFSLLHHQRDSFHDGTEARERPGPPGAPGGARPDADVEAGDGAPGRELRTWSDTGALAGRDFATFTT